MTDAFEHEKKPFMCSNCARPLATHCVVHLIPCCQGKCPGASPAIDARRLLRFLALIEDDMGDVIYGPQHNDGRRAALHQVRVYVTALIEPEVAA